MKKFVVSGDCRPYGAIGVFTGFRWEMEAESEAVLIDKLYSEKKYDFRTISVRTAFVPTHIVIEQESGDFAFKVGEKLRLIGGGYFKSQFGNVKHVDDQYVQLITPEANNAG